MTLESFYLICFLVGFLLSLVAFVAQAVDLGGSHDLHGHTHAGHAHGGHGHGHGHTHAGARGGSTSAAVSKLNFSTLSAFLAWFGGAGYLINRYSSMWTMVGLGVAALTGIAGAAMVFWVLAKLVGRDHTMNPADYDMIGVLGQLTSPIRQGGIGEIVFSQNGVRRAAPVRSEDGEAISKGIEVVVTRYERGVGYVRRWDEMTGLADSDISGSRVDQ